MPESGAPRVRKRLLDSESADPVPGGAIDLASAATLAYSSEDPAFPLEGILNGDGSSGRRWMSARPNTTEQIVVEFDQPQPISRVVYEVDETTHERTQEVRIEASTDGAKSYRQVVVQEYNFSPRGATHEREDLHVELSGVTHLRLTIVPAKQGAGAATLSSLQIYV